MLCYAMLCDGALRCVGSRYSMLCHAKLCHVIFVLCHVMSYSVTSRHAMLRSVTSRYVNLCDAMLCKVMPCCVASRHVTIFMSRQPLHVASRYVRKM